MRLTPGACAVTGTGAYGDGPSAGWVRAMGDRVVSVTVLAIPIAGI